MAGRRSQHRSSGAPPVGPNQGESRAGHGLPRPSPARRGAAWLVSLLTCGSLGCLEYSPHQLPTDESERDLNRKAVEAIRSQPVERLRFAVVGDTQRFFVDSADVVDAINARDDVQFVVQIGDFAHVGILLEFRLMKEIFDRLRVPYLVTVGYHEHLGNGRAIYEEMFGSRDFAFDQARTRLVFFDSNSASHDFDGTVPAMEWLAARLAPSPDHDRAIAFSHVPAGAPDFDGRLTAPFDDLMAGSNVELAFHGHAHRYLTYERLGVRVVVVDAVNHRSFVLVTQRPDGGFEYEKVEF
jgi:3',5'-cyclic-AMP phosphodiesterase